MRVLVVLALLSVLAASLVVGSSAGRAAGPLPRDLKFGGGAQLSGAAEEGRAFNLGTGITECPQAGNTNPNKPLDRRQIDQVEQLSTQGDDRRSNADYSCFPQNEVSVDINPRNPDNFVIGANDYRLGTGSSGFQWTTNGGKTFYDGIIPFPSGPGAQTRGEGFIISGGDPVIAYDRAGVVYYAQIAFFRGDDTNGVFVQRSTNGGATWTRACVPIGATDAAAVCGGPGDARQPGDGRVSFNPDNDPLLNGSVPFDDKEYMTTGPRPAGVQPVCFTPVTRVPTPCNPAVVGVDRIYVTWTRFTATASQINLSHSDDQGRSWSPRRVINGSAAFCAFAVASATACDDNQFSVPTTNPKTGQLWVAFENFNTPDENQYVVVRSNDGGATFTGPFFVTPIFDLNFPRAGIQRPDCTPRGAQTFRIVYTNSCFRSNPAGNIVADRRGGAFADDLYLVMADNRNGTTQSSNSDVFLFKSTNGGATWIGPTRVNNDRSSLGTVSRDCRRPEGSIGFLAGNDPAADALCRGDFGADQWWPWVDIGPGGELNIAMKDRRLDTNSIAHEWPTSRNRPGNYLVWTWGAQCRVRNADSRECLAQGATVIPQPTAPVNPGADPVPGQGDQYVGTLTNFKVSDVPSNYDYSFRAGIFAGDYENIAVSDGRGSGGGDDDRRSGDGNDRSGGSDDDGESDVFAINVFTDARNGRSSRNQPGRNPICEQADIFFDIYSARGVNGGGSAGSITPFLVTPCPAQAVEPKNRDRDRDEDD